MIDSNQSPLKDISLCRTQQSISPGSVNQYIRIEQGNQRHQRP